MASAASNVSIDEGSGSDAGTKIFDASTDGGPATTRTVRCRSDSSFPVEVRVVGYGYDLHKAAEWALIPVGEAEPFRLGVDGIKEMYARGVGGAADIDHHNNVRLAV